MNKTIILIITVLSLFIRLYHLNQYPPLLWDEASLGYNAYSILKTGRDEYGQPLPLIFKSFGDYKPGLYIYLCLPFVALFGLNTLSVRLPSAILGSFCPLLLYLLIKKLSPKSGILALLSAILLAFNPWNIHFSRGAWETNILLFEILLASYLFFRQKYITSSLTFAATLYTYQGGKLISPLLIVILLIINFHQLNIKKFLFKFIIPLFLLSIPMLYGLFYGQDSNRLQVFSLYSYNRPETEIQQIIKESSAFDYQVFHSRTIYFFRNFFLRYFNLFSSKFLAFAGDWQTGRHSAPYLGVVLYPTFVLFYFGLFSSLSRLKRPIFLFFFLWLIVSPLLSALTRDIIQPVRSLPFSLPLIFFSAFGLKKLFKLFPYKFFYITVLLSYFLSFFYYSDLYLNHMVSTKSDDWLYGYQQAMIYAIDHSENRQVFFTDFYGQPYIYYLFYSRYHPATYQSHSYLSQTGIDVGHVDKINNFHFQSPNFSHLSSQPNTLIIISYDEVIRQGIDINLLIPLSPIGNHSTFYAYQT